MNSLKALTTRTWLVIAGIVVLALIGVGAALYLLNTDEDSDATVVRTDTCKVDQIEQFVDAIEVQDLTKLRELRENITQQDGYEGSANCQYMLLRQSIADGEADRAQSELDRVRQLAPRTAQLSSQFGSTAVEYDVLQDSIDTLRVNQTLTDEEKRFWGNE